MEFLDFHYFIKVCRYGSITEAAKASFISQQALSARIRSLEDELGSPLFIRSKKGVRLTDFGQNVQELFSPLVTEYEKTLTRLTSEAKAESGEIVFAITPYVFDSLGPDIISSFIGCYPQYPLRMAEIKEDEALDSLTNSASRFFLVSDIDAEQFASYRSVPLASCHRNLILHKDHPLAKRKSLRFLDIADEPFFALDQRMALESLALAHLSKWGKQLNIVLRGSDPILFLDLINQNKGVMIAAPISTDRFPYENIRQVPILDSFLDFRPAFVFKDAAVLKAQDKVFIHYVLEQTRSLKKK